MHGVHDEREKSEQISPETENARPGWLKERDSGMEPRCKKSGTDMAEPIQLGLRAKRGELKETKSEINTSDSILTIFRIERLLPNLAEFRSSNVNSTFWGSRAKRDRSKHARPCGKSMKPR